MIILLTIIAVLLLLVGAGLMRYALWLSPCDEDFGDLFVFGIGVILAAIGVIALVVLGILALVL